MIIDPALHMWFVLALTVLAVVLFVREKLPLEVSSLVVFALLLLFGYLYPLPGPDGENVLNPQRLLAGFANDSLIAVLALLVMGQAMIHTDALRLATVMFQKADRHFAWLAVSGVLVFVMLVSAFMNNTPLVVICIPIMQVLAQSLGVSESRIMIPLSYAAILGGMTTLIGSSTNLLVSSAMVELGYKPLQFFDFVVPGAMLAGIGFLYIIFVLPRLLPDRASMVQKLSSGKKEFVAEIEIAPDSHLIGAECVDGKFPALSGMNIKLIQRGGQLILPPFEDYKAEPGDVLIVSATRSAIMSILAKYPGFLLTEEDEEIISHVEEGASPAAASVASESRVLAEVMITPASRMVDMALENVSFHRQFGTIVLGIQRRAKVVRRRLGRIRLEAGDVLLVAGRQSVINALRDNPDFIVLSGSKRDLPPPGKAPLSVLIFVLTVVSAALGLLSVTVAAITGAVAMILTGCLNIRQASRAIDRKIFLMVGAMLAVGSALQATGGAAYLADLMLSLPFVDTPFMVAAVLFILIAIATNILSNNACAILFTPIALSLAKTFQGSAPEGLDLGFLYAVVVVFAANCSFATPIGYQTNLLVIGPGHYRFRDFVNAGVPLVVIMWLGFMAILKFYFGL